MMHPRPASSRHGRTRFRIMSGSRTSSKSSSSSSSSIAVTIAISTFLAILRRCSSAAALATMMLPATTTTTHRIVIMRGGGRPMTTTTRRRPPPPQMHRGRSPKATTAASYCSSYCSSSSSSSSSSTTTTTALHFFFDKFHQPYGISSSEDEDDEDDSELLDALLPRLPTREDRSRAIEGFQRARLCEQLRLSRTRKRKRGVDGGGEGGREDGKDDDDIDDGGGGGGDGGTMDDLAVDHVADEDNARDDGDGTSERARRGGRGIAMSRPNDVAFDKDEAFQRALLGERLRIGRLQRRAVEGGSTTIECERDVERRSMEFEAPRSMTMVMEEEEVVEEGVANHAGEDGSNECRERSIEDDRYETLGIGIASSANDDGRDGNGGDVTSAKDLSANRTEEGVPSDRSVVQLDVELEMLRHMVTSMTRPSSSSSDAIGAIAANNNASSSIRNFLSTTYLPLPPREDASFMSLALAPVAHLASSLFLLGAGGFYALMAIADVICNDDGAECSTRACLRLTSSILANCWGRPFLREGGRGGGGGERRRNDGVDSMSVVPRMTRALRTSAIASYYAVAFVLLRSSRHSKYAHESMDAVTGSLRYLVYAMRSTKVALTRTMNSIQRSSEFVVRWIRTCVTSVRAFNHDDEKVNTMKSLRRWLNPLHVISNVKRATAQRADEKGTLEDEVKQLRLDELYGKKLRLLNLDRLAFERERKQLQEAKEQLEIEKSKLLAEGVNVLSWYAAAGELAAKESHEAPVKRKDRKRHFWRGRRDRDK